VTGDDATSEAAQLAERIVDEVSRPSQHWRKIAAIARELAAVADAAAARGGGVRTEEP
jgi:hypothetical protein